MAKKNPHETRGRKRLDKYDAILKYIRSRSGRNQHGEITFASENPGKDAEQFRALTAFKDLQKECDGMVFSIFTKASGFVICWEEGLR